MTDGTIEDGFGNAWSETCPTCGEQSMEVVRPGKVQCVSDKCYYRDNFLDWLNHHGCSKEELWKIQNCIGAVFGFNQPVYLAAKQAWEYTAPPSSHEAK
jgi:hypothetical protein